MLMKVLIWMCTNENVQQVTEQVGEWKLMKLLKEHAPFDAFSFEIMKTEISEN